MDFPTIFLTKIDEKKRFFPAPKKQPKSSVLKNKKMPDSGIDFPKIRRDFSHIIIWYRRKFRILLLFQFLGVAHRYFLAVVERNNERVGVFGADGLLVSRRLV